MNIVDLMADLDWSDTDIVKRTESLLASQFPNVQILQRKVQGQMLGQYTLTTDEQAQLQAYAAASFAAGSDADQARSDMALLRQTWTYESAQAALAADPTDADAQATISGSSQDVINLAAARAANRQTAASPDVT
jgi:hypothetical protein